MHIKCLEQYPAHSSSSINAHYPYHHSNLRWTKMPKLQFDGQTLSMEGHNDIVFGEVNPESV